MNFRIPLILGFLLFCSLIIQDTNDHLMSTLRKVYRVKSKKFVPKDGYRTHKEQLNYQV